MRPLVIFVGLGALYGVLLRFAVPSFSEYVVAYVIFLVVSAFTSLSAYSYSVPASVEAFGSDYRKIERAARYGGYAIPHGEDEPVRVLAFDLDFRAGEVHALMPDGSHQVYRGDDYGTKFALTEKELRR